MRPRPDGPVTLGRVCRNGPWHIFVGRFDACLCGRVYPHERCSRRTLSGAAQARRVRGAVCSECLRRLMRISRIGDALNERLP